MNTFTISSKLNKNKVFILQKSELEKRLDPFFYVPELLELEKKVLAKKPKKLRDYVVSIASGATPKRAEEEKYYANATNGIPFLRVQNLSQTGVLSLNNTKYINKETHNGMLKRSQVAEGDLLVKITGVGRMAVASVAPENFEGNINQHVCVIKTKDRKESELLASFLNSDIGEKLASRRSTGGTRPALDYPALLSIPIIEDERILKIKKELIKQKTLNEQKAKDLLNSIDAYLFDELGIKLPKKAENTLKNRIFTRSIKEISGSRFDPYFNLDYFDEIYDKIIQSKFPNSYLKYIFNSIQKGIEVGSKKYKTKGIPFIRVADIDDFDIYTKKCKFIERDNYISLKTSFQPKINEILYSKDGSIGFCNIVKEEKEYIISSGILRLSVIKDYNNYFVKHLLSTSLYKELANRVSIGTVIKHLTIEDWLKIPFPKPPKEKQDEIANHIKSIRDKAQALKDKTKELIETANKEIENILLN
ncbi:restriction endonuclease subunit S [Lutibacter sp.]